MRRRRSDDVTDWSFPRLRGTYLGERMKDKGRGERRERRGWSRGKRGKKEERTKEGIVAGRAIERMRGGEGKEE